LVLFPNCKINLGLRVVSKRADGYHDLDTVFFPIPLRDAAEVVLADVHRSIPDGLKLHLSGLDIKGNLHDNLCYRAWQLLKRDFPNIPPLEFYLHKAIPSGAGLGGGSSDAAFSLRMINELLDLDIPVSRLMQYALLLGSDCPFFIVNKPCYATGRGENLKEIDLDLSAYNLVLVHPPVHIGTGWAFSESAKLRTQHGLPQSSEDIVSRPVPEWRDNLINDFEEAVFAAYPQIGAVKNLLYNRGAVYAAMTGTGSCIYGLFHRKHTPSLQDIDPSFKVYHLKTVL
jgi:4-diphosphocytidyl-2-C-methyl-D-erythritol kinase